MSSFVTAGTQISESDLLAQNAQETANTNATGIKNINDPNYLSPFEKPHLKVQMDNFATIYASDKDIATAEGIDFTAYDAAYQAYLTYMTPLVADKTTYSPIVRSTFNSMVTAVQVEQKRFSTATQAQYDQQIKKAQTDIDDGQTKYKALQSEAETMKSSVAGVASAADRAISSAGFASNTASAASQAASSALAGATSAQNNASSAVAKAESTALAFGPVKQNADSALTAALSAQTDASSAVSKAESAASAFGKVDQKADSAAASAATAFSVANAARDSAASAINSAANALNKVNGMQFGGTNLLRDTGFSEDGHPYWRGPADLGVTDGYLNHKAVSFDNTSSTGSNIDFQQIIYDSNTKLIKLGQWHALSFYAKGSGRFASFVYPLTIDRTAGAYADGQFISLAPPDGNNFWTLTDDWVRHTYIFKTNASISTDANAVQLVLWRSYVGTKVSICMPQLEQGNVVSDYSQSPLDVQVQISDINDQLESKVSQTTYGQLADLVSDTSTLAKQNKSELLTKANEQTVDLLKQTVDNQATSIDETAKKVELKADESKVDTIAGTVDSQAATLKIMAGDISGLTNSTKTLGGQYTTLSGQFNLSSQTWETNFSKVTNNLNKLSTRNLLRNSDFVNDTGYWTSSGSQSISVDTANRRNANNSMLITATGSGNGNLGTTRQAFLGNYLAGDPISLSFWAKAPVPVTLHTEINGGKGSQNINITIDWQYFTVNFTFVDSANFYFWLTSAGSVSINSPMLVNSPVAVGWVIASNDQATVTALTQVKQTAEGASQLSQDNQGNILSLQTTAKGLQTSVSNAATKDQLTLLSSQLTNQITDLTSSTSSQFTQTANDINGLVKKGDVVNQFNIDAGGALLSTSGDSTKIVFSSPNIIFDTTNPVQIPNANIPGTLTNKTFEAGTITATTKITGSDIEAPIIHSPSGSFKLDGNTGDIIGASIHSADNSWGIDKKGNINGATINAPNLDLGFNGTFTESYDYTQDTGWFLPKKATGSVTFDHGVIEDQGTMQTYANGVWGGKNDSSVFTAGLTNNVWTEYAPGYYKIDMYKQGSTSNVLQRTYADPTGFYYTSPSGVISYFGNVLSVPQVQTGGVLTPYIGPSKEALRVQISQNGKDSGLEVGSYAGSEAVLSDFIYNSTSSHSPDIHITENGRLVRTTSASKYKYNIKNPDIETTLGDRLLNMHLATWNDKRAVDSYAEQLSTGEEREKSSIDKYYGLIAEQLRDAGLDMFISYGKNHEIEGIQYDRAWIPLLSVIRRLNDKVSEYELRISKLEGASK